MRGKLKALMAATAIVAIPIGGQPTQAQIYYTINGQPAAPAVTQMMAQRGLAPGAYWYDAETGNWVAWVVHILWATFRTAGPGAVIAAAWVLVATAAAVFTPRWDGPTAERCRPDREWGLNWFQALALGSERNGLESSGHRAYGVTLARSAQGPTECRSRP